MKKALLTTAAVLVSFLAAGCSRGGDAKAAADAAAPAAASAEPDGASAPLGADNAAKSEKFLADNAKKQGVKTTASGLQYEVLTEGPATGASPKETDLVDVHYVGTLIDGLEFDSPRAPEAPPRAFRSIK